MSGIDLPVLLDQRPMSRFQWLVVVLCACVLFFDGFDTQAISYAAPMIAREWHLSHAMLGSVFSAALAGLMAGYLLIAPLSDRFGPKRLIVASTALFGVLTLLTILVNATQALIALRFLTGIWLGAAAPGAVTLTSEYSPQRLRATFVLVIYCGFSLGFVAAGAIAAPLLHTYGWRSLFVIGGFLPLALCPFLIWSLPESLDYLLRRQAPAERVDPLLRQLDLTLPATIQAKASSASGTGLCGLLRGRRYTLGTLLLWLIFVINVGAFYLLQSWLPTLLTGLHRSLHVVASAASLTTVGGIVAAFVVGPAMDRFGASAALAVLYAAGALVVGLLGLALPADLWKLLAASFGAGFCISGGQKSAIALASVFYPAALRSTGVGWALGIGRIGGIGGPLLAGFLLNAGWTPVWLFDLVAFAMLLTSIATLALSFVSRDHLAPSATAVGS
jgi:AAHS family 4-hydroxybenzoate transporter-like MFS transporter